MTGIGWFAAIFVGGIAGWLAERYMERDHSVLTNIFLGIVGALVFNALITVFFADVLGGWLGQGFSGFVGACVLIAGWHLTGSGKG
jgi:uncharacterized membrane protein YeaQ/YmgE (transglycosylase-associated protein family)